MAGVFTLSSSFLPSLHLPYQPRFPSLGRSVFIHLPVKCQLGSSDSNDESESKKRNHLKLLKLSVTLTVVSTSLPQPVLAAKVSDKKRSSKKSSKFAEALTVQELKQWTEGLPVVANRIPYSEILNLKREGKLKRIVKPATAGLKRRPSVVLAVLEDSRVVRTVLPSAESDVKFWEEWDEMKIDSVCVNAYSPPVKNPEVPSPYLGLLLKIPTFLFDTFKPKPVPKAVLEFRKERQEDKRQRAKEAAELKREKLKEEKLLQLETKMEDRIRRKEIMLMKAQQAVTESELEQEEYVGESIWDFLAEDKGVSTILGIFFFIIFYQVVVVSYKKKKKDYADRVKIKAIETEEKKKMKELERERSGFEYLEGGEEIEGGEENKEAYMKVASEFMQSGALVRRKDSKNATKYLDQGEDVKFSDVAGLGKIRIELEEVVKFFTEGDEFRKRGVTIPGGILLCGPPGVGKTLLAKAVAGEAGVSFFSVSASQFVEMYVGVGASRVRALYDGAKRAAPAVVFIDEIDAVGRLRGMVKNSGGAERDATLNQLLVCLDGFQGRGDVITIASTNRPDILDPALIRPGRFDRKIFIPRPGVIGRIEILKVHARGKPMAKDVDYGVVAAATTGMVGAELANVIEVAGANMMREGRTEITTDDLLMSTQEEERGLLDRNTKSPSMWKQIAYSEAAIAIVAINFPDLSKVEFLTIAPRGGKPLGYIRMSMDSFKFRTGMLSRQSLLAHITVQLAKRAGEEIMYGEGQISTLCSKTTNNARAAARVYALCLSEKHHGIQRRWTKDRIDEIDTEALQILNKCQEQAKEILQRNRKLWEVVAEELAEKKSMTKYEFFDLVELYGSIKPFPPTILEIRRERLQIMETAAGPTS